MICFFFVDSCSQRGFPFAWCHKKKSRNGTFIGKGKLSFNFVCCLSARPLYQTFRREALSTDYFARSSAREPFRPILMLTRWEPIAPLSICLNLSSCYSILYMYVMYVSHPLSLSDTFIHIFEIISFSTMLCIVYNYN